VFLPQWIRLISSEFIYSNWVKFGPNWRPTKTQAVIRRPTTTKVWVWSRARVCRISDGRSGNVAGLYPTNLVCPVSITLLVLHIHFFNHRQSYIMTAIKGSNNRLKKTNTIIRNKLESLWIYCVMKPGLFLMHNPSPNRFISSWLQGNALLMRQLLRHKCEAFMDNAGVGEDYLISIRLISVSQDNFWINLTNNSTSV